jgi:hypothetical protein
METLYWYTRLWYSYSWLREDGNIPDGWWKGKPQTKKQQLGRIA